MWASRWAFDSFVELLETSFCSVETEIAKQIRGPPLFHVYRVW